MNLAQINLFVTDFATMVAFYRDVLGFQTNDIEPGPPCEPGVNWVSLRTGSVVIELFDAAVFWDRALLQTANRSAAQLCFLVDDVTGERTRLTAGGVDMDPVVTEQWGSYASFRDPEGNWLQIFEVFARA